jgi:hypothetical protein
MPLQFHGAMLASLWHRVKCHSWPSDVEQTMNEAYPVELSVDYRDRRLNRRALRRWARSWHSETGCGSRSCRRA